MVLTFDEYARIIARVGLDGSKEQDALLALYATLAASELNAEQARTVLEIFSEEGLQALSEIPQSVLEARWKEFDYGNVRAGDFVRVKEGAYGDSETGARHEGRIGTLLSVYKYRCTVRYIGLHAGNTMVHPMKNLESMER